MHAAHLARWHVAAVKVKTVYWFSFVEATYTSLTANELCQSALNEVLFGAIESSNAASSCVSSVILSAARSPSFRLPRSPPRESSSSLRRRVRSHSCEESRAGGAGVCRLNQPTLPNRTGGTERLHRPVPLAQNRALNLALEREKTNVSNLKKEIAALREFAAQGDGGAGGEAAVAGTSGRAASAGSAAGKDREKDAAPEKDPAAEGAEWKARRAARARVPLASTHDS